MAFSESPRFPDELSFQAIGGRGFLTIVAETYGGDEYRNAAWRYARGKWEIPAAWRLQDANQGGGLNNFGWIALRNMFANGFGRLGGFRVKIWDDYKDDAGGVLGTTGLAIAATTAYQMFKNYGSGTYQHKILKPVAATIKIYDNAVLKTITADYTLDSTTGIVTFTSQPTIGHALTWTGEFDTPCRFEEDVPVNGMNNEGANYEWQGLKLIELKNP
jgi:uncharacterized protein (TIGR02217 family)